MIAPHVVVNSENMNVDLSCLFTLCENQHTTEPTDFFLAEP